MCKCYYMDCCKKGIVLDKIEVAPQQYETHLVCKKHVGRKLEYISKKGKISGTNTKLVPATFN